MQDPMSLFTLTSVGHDLRESLRSSRALREVEDLTLVVLFTGHHNAGCINNVLRDEFNAELENELLASFDVDQLINYRDRRPTITFAGDHFTEYLAPKMHLRLAYDQAQRPFLLLTGPEPDLQWERFTQAILNIIEDLHVKLTVIMEGLPMPVPHTRPLGLTVHGNAGDRLAGLSTFTPMADLSASAAMVLEYRLTEAQRDVLGLTLHIPHYLAEMVYPQGAVAAIEYLSAATGLSLPSDKLREQGRDLDTDIAQQVAQSQEALELVQKLETNFDEYAEEKAPRSLLVDENEEIPDAEVIATSLQEFLSTQPRHTTEPTQANQPMPPELEFKQLEQRREPDEDA
ncbi:proteasome assembly chaperone family protein [Micrococcoides hystricis]|uniref:Proteasome assembly chaperone family protein n=1 Tax=Micrococcoides hystricis TaxID=1572761 RepID=A0ABV6P7Q2_9MICC